MFADRFGNLINEPFVNVEWDMLTNRGKITDTNLGYKNWNVFWVSKNQNELKISRFRFSEPKIVKLHNVSVTYINEAEFREQYRAQKNKQ